MNSQIVWGIIIMVIGSGIGTYLIQKGRTSLAFKNNQKLIKHINSLDSTSRTEIIKELNLNRDQIVTLVNSQTKSSAIEIISEVQNKFGLIQEDLEHKEEQIQELEKKEALRLDKKKKLEKLKSTPPEIEVNNVFFDENDLLNVQIELKNKVPIKYKFHISNEKGYEISNRVQTSKSELFPKNKYRFYNLQYKDVKAILKARQLSEHENHLVTLNISFESIYYSETRNPNLKKQIEYPFEINLKSKKVIKK